MIHILYQELCQCQDCPYCIQYDNEGTEIMCTYAEKPFHIDDISKIPEACPLPVKPLNGHRGIGEVKP